MTNNPLRDRFMRAGIAFAVIATIAVGLRCEARKRSKAAFFADDLLIALCLLPLYGMVAIGSMASKESALGRPRADIPQWQFSFILKLLMFGNVTYGLTITMVKISIRTMYRRIFATAACRKRVNAIGAACLMWFIAFTLVEIFQCYPLHDAFDPKFLLSSHCIKLEAFYLAAAATNLAIDIAMLCLPLHMVWKLSLDRKQKIGPTAIFLVGIFACLGGAMRIAAIVIIKHEDLTMTVAAGFLWSQIEPGTAILCACAVTYRPLFTNVNLHLRISLPLRLSQRLHQLRRVSHASTTCPHYAGELDSRIDEIGSHLDDASQPAHYTNRQDYHRRHERCLPHIEGPNLDQVMTQDDDGVMHVGMYQEDWQLGHIRTEPSKSEESPDERVMMTPRACDEWPLRVGSLGARILRAAKPRGVDEIEEIEMSGLRPSAMPMVEGNRRWELRRV